MVSHVFLLQIHCWGQPDSPILIDIPIVTNVVTLALGQNFGCALFSNGSTACWGPSLSLPGFTVPSVPLSFIAADGATVCGILTDNVTVQCWGSNIPTESSAVFTWPLDRIQIAIPKICVHATN